MAGWSPRRRCSSDRASPLGPTACWRGWRCAADHAGFPVVDGTGRTTTPGVWAAGNAADPRAQVITAAGAGSAAAIAINADLVDDDVATVLEQHLAAGRGPARPVEA